MAAPPTGTVTLLFTDVEGSTRLLHDLGPEAYADELAAHRKVVRTTLARLRMSPRVRGTQRPQLEDSHPAQEEDDTVALFEGVAAGIVSRQELREWLESHLV